MSNIDEKEDRKNYIGGIDAPVIVLPNPKWKTKYQLWFLYIDPLKQGLKRLLCNS